MNNIERIFEAVCNILSVYVSFKVTDVFLEKKRKLPRMANIVYVIVWLINTVVAFGFRNAMGTTVSMVLLLWAAEGILYEGSILQKIMAGCFTVLLGLTIEFIMYYYLGDFSLFSEGRAMGTITGAMVSAHSNGNKTGDMSAKGYGNTELLLYDSCISRKYCLDICS